MYAKPLKITPQTWKDGWRLFIEAGFPCRCWDENENYFPSQHEKPYSNVAGQALSEFGCGRRTSLIPAWFVWPGDAWGWWLGGRCSPASKWSRPLRDWFLCPATPLIKAGLGGSPLFEVRKEIPFRRDGDLQKLSLTFGSFYCFPYIHTEPVLSILFTRCCETPVATSRDWHTPGYHALYAYICRVAHRICRKHGLATFTDVICFPVYWRLFNLNA